MQLKVKNIRNKDDFEVYLQIVESFDIINPFYKILGASLNSSILNQLNYFKLINDSNTTIILMPFFLRKIPHQVNEVEYFDIISPYGYSGPLYNDSMSRGYLVEFWKLVDDWYKKNNVVSEFIRFSLNHNHQFYSGILVPTLSNVNGTIMDTKRQWNHFSQKVRNNYRKAQNSGLHAIFFDKDLSNDVIITFYYIYIETMERIGAKNDYFYSLNYIKNIIALSKENFAVVIVYKDNIAISTELVLISGETLYSFLGGTLVEYFPCRPNDFLKLEVLKWARLHKYKYYLLGGGRKDCDTLYRYKKTFFPGDKDIIFYTGRKIINKKVYNYLSTILNENLNLNIEHTHQVEEQKPLGYFPAYRGYLSKNKS